MNKTSRTLSLIITFILCCCKMNDTSDLIFSSYDSMESHDTGEDCMKCHQSGGDAGLVFSIAGTVYNSNLKATFPNTTINLYVDIDLGDTPIEVIEVDGKGNFYSNIPIDWQNGLFASISNNNEIKVMNGTIYEGSCNSCHGVTIPHINIEQ